MLVLWEYHQQHFEFWEEGQLNIYEGLEDYKLVISAKRGETNKGYVAIDDFFFEAVSAESCEIKPAGAEPGSSSTSTSSPAPPPPPFPDCDFEENFCGVWHTDEQINGTALFVFIRTSGSLHDGGDGPQTDHANNPNSENIALLAPSFNHICLRANFLWTNAEFGTAGDEATISSSAITAEESLCFNFWFDLTVSISPHITSLLMVILILIFPAHGRHQ